MTTQKPVVASKPVWLEAINQSESKFVQSKLDFQQEQVFATQLLMNNKYLLSCAMENSQSLRLAMYSVAAVGLTLNPNLGLAYLVPRRVARNEPVKIQLDISYRGLINIAVDSGAILWAKAQLVFENDTFIFNGPAEKPTHQFNPFDENRGRLVGGYCVAQLPSGSFLIETMSYEDMEKIKHASEAFKKGFGPWIDWEEQMQLKSLVKRAFKWWPVTHSKMGDALKILNEDNGEGFVSINQEVQPSEVNPATSEQVPLKLRNEIQQWITRAVNSKAYEACKELMHSRIKEPAYLSFALDELEAASKANTENVMVSNS